MLCQAHCEDASLSQWGSAITPAPVFGRTFLDLYSAAVDILLKLNKTVPHQSPETSSLGKAKK